VAEIYVNDPERPVSVRRGILGPGISAGVLAAIIMGLVLVILSSLRGMGFWTPVELIGATYVGRNWIAMPVVSTLAGLGTHLVLGAFFGVLFRAMTRNVLNNGIRIAAGMAYGAVLFLVMTFLVLPWANPVMYATMNRGLFFLAHLVFGLALPLALPMTHRTHVAPPVERRVP
jgi:hypothetical protein